MRLVESADIEAGAQAVYARLTDVALGERIAADRGARLFRPDGGRMLTVGSDWQAEVPYRGRMRTLTSHVTALDPPQKIALAGESGGFAFTLSLTLAPLSRQATRLWSDLEVRPRTLSARILLQTLKLGRGRLRARYAQRLAHMAQALQDQIAMGG